MKNLIKKLLIRCKNTGKKVILSSGCTIGAKSTFEGHNYIGKKTIFDGSIGYGSYMGDNCRVFAAVGRYSSIADNVTVVNGEHPTKIIASTHPVFYSNSNSVKLNYGNESKFTEYSYADKDKKYPVVIGNDVWIGHSAILLSGITIGDGAIIASGAVVVKDVPPYTIVGGVPAKSIRKRFTDEQISILTKAKWWERDENWIIEHYKDFENIECLTKTLEKEE